MMTPPPVPDLQFWLIAHNDQSRQTAIYRIPQRIPMLQWIESLGQAVKVLRPPEAGRLMQVVRPTRPKPFLCAPLSPREQEVLAELAEGRTQKEIAWRFCLSTHTINTHVQNIYRKMQVKSNTEAVARALRAGLV